MRHLGLPPLVLLTLVAGCSKGGFSQRSQVQKEDVFRYPIVTSPTSMDPAITQDGDTLDLIQQIYEGLVTWSPTNDVVPSLAEKWEVVDGGKKYIFTLRSDAKFHNGRLVTAEDVKWSYERCTNPKLASQTADAYLSDIVGVTDKVNGRAQEVSGIKVLDDKRIEITLKQPTPYFLGKLTYLVGAVVPKELVPADSEIRDKSQMVGTGPFKLQDYVPDQIVILSANTDYYLGAPKVSRIERPIIKDALTRLNKYKNGELDLVMLERQDIEAIKADPALKDHLKLFPRPSLWYVAMSPLNYAPFKDKRVRQAFGMAIDKRRIVEELLGGVNEIANGIVPPGMRGHRPDAKSLKYDPARAKALLAEAGFPDASKMPALTLTFREARPDIKIAAEAVASQLKQNLGVDVKLQTMEWRAYLEKYNRKEHAFVHMRWAADYLDPQNFLSHMLSTDGPENKMGMNNKQFDDLCKQADSLLTWEERLPLYAQAEDIALDEAVWFPLYFQKDAELHRPGLEGVRESLFGHLPHTTVSIKK